MHGRRDTLQDLVSSCELTNEHLINLQVRLKKKQRKQNQVSFCLRFIRSFLILLSGKPPQLG